MSNIISEITSLFFLKLSQDLGFNKIKSGIYADDYKLDIKSDNCEFYSANVEYDPNIKFKMLCVVLKEELECIIVSITDKKYILTYNEFYLYTENICNFSVKLNIMDIFNILIGEGVAFIPSDNRDLKTVFDDFLQD
jgi:hypothetical protein